MEAQEIILQYLGCELERIGLLDLYKQQNNVAFSPDYLIFRSKEVFLANRPHPYFRIFIEDCNIVVIEDYYESMGYLNQEPISLVFPLSDPECFDKVMKYLLGEI